ncbi:MAG TPA: chemotaxis protein CheB, partial [Vicinamibacteria bacterium]|nr:chemotaxis protein CheB [Vicinamibacteria bacterium]
MAEASRRRSAGGKKKPAVAARRGGARRIVPQGPPGQRQQGTEPPGGDGQPAAVASTAPAETAVPVAEEAHLLTIVGVGMSAGGLEAVSQLLDALPPTPGFAIVVVQHLSRHQESALPMLLSTHTKMPVAEAQDGVQVERGRVYVSPPDFAIELSGGRFQVTQRDDEPGHLLPVDAFFQSLAADQGDRSVAVILSGTGSDGVLGCRAVKAQGGTVLVQEPGSCRYDGMPRSTITAGIADV